MRPRTIAILVLAAAALPSPGMTAPGAASPPPDDSVYTALLAMHVREGHVNYAGLRHDDRLEKYLGMLSATDPEKLGSTAAKLAFWINAYNAFTVQLICDNYPVESINDLHFGGRIVGHVIGKTAWDRKFIMINGEEMTLNHIEHDIIREQFDEPRIHFALVCAAVSCPPLRSEAYTADELDGQLDDQAKTFMRDKTKNRFDLVKKEAYLSSILDWYGKDFGPDKAAVLAAVAKFLPRSVASAIEADTGAWKVSYLEYDWKLNE